MINSKLIKAFTKGLFTFVPGLVWVLKKQKSKSVHSGSNALFCYNLWLRFLVHLNENRIGTKFNKIGEIGNGGSFGVGICAILTGSKEYFALEIEKVFDVDQNLKLLDEIVSLFKNKTPISEKTKLSIDVKCLDYPEQLIEPLFLNDQFVEVIRKDIQTFFNQQNMIHFAMNWHSAPTLNLDFIFSRAVLEHVKNPADVYASAKSHMKEGAVMLHDIEFHSHNITAKLDGHYKIPKNIWKIIYGKRSYFLNRWTLNDHLTELMQQNIKTLSVTEKLESSVTGKPVLIGASILSKI